jgi:hypothetical protein
MPKLIRKIVQGEAQPRVILFHEEPSPNRAVGVSHANPLPTISLPGSVSAVQFIDEDGNAYGIKQVDNKPRVSSMPYLYDIAEGNIPNHNTLRKFGYNGNVGAVLEDIWGGETVYTYLTAAEQLQIVSSDVDDQGNVVSTGTATGGSTTTLIDTGATFIGDGVAVGDIVLNDTRIAHGIVRAVDSQIQITVENPFRDSDSDTFPKVAIPFENGDAYRIVNANDTGAAVVIIKGLDGNYDPISEYIVLNGTTDVTALQSYLRIFRMIVVLAGTTGANEGAIDAENNASTLLLARIPIGLNQTSMALWTVPRDNIAFLTSFYASTSSIKVTLVDLYIRPFGETFQIKRRISINQTATRLPYDLPLAIAQKSDITIRASSVAGGGAVAAGFDMWYEEP